MRDDVKSGELTPELAGTIEKDDQIGGEGPKQGTERTEPKKRKQ